MLRSLWIAKTGMDAQQTSLDTISNNLANVSTTAYKRVRPIFEDLLYQNIRSPGLNEDSEPTEAFVLRADGSIFGRKSTGWFSKFEGTKLMPGDTVVVPSKVDRESGYNTLMRGLRDWTQIFSNLGIGAAAIKTLKN